MIIRDYPIDRELMFEAGQSFVTLKFLPFNEPIFQEHFAERSVYPGSMIMNSVLATADLYLMRTRSSVSSEFAAVPLQVKYRKAAEPGELLRIELDAAGAAGAGDSMTFKVTEFFGGALLCHGSLIIDSLSKKSIQ
jgi:3-hydroxymyristoyl/3-hydroxydecanoyl-(acyl carrier protein) dehydratase